MKMRVLDRLLMGLCALISIVLALLIADQMIRTSALTLSFFGYYIEIMDKWIAIPVVVAIALLVLAVRLVLLALGRTTTRSKSSVSVQDTGDGSVRVSLQAMDMLVKQAVAGAEGVAEIKTSVVNHEDAVTVHVDMTLNSDVYIPSTTMLLQRNIKSFIEKYSGITVREVTVLVNKIIEVQPRPPLQIEEPKNEPLLVIDQIEAEPVEDSEDHADSKPEEAVDTQEDSGFDIVEDQEPVADAAADDDDR